jgi:outer membrane receptor protein involved in Fe transport
MNFSLRTVAALVVGISTIFLAGQLGVIAQTQPGTVVAGRVLDIDGGLPVARATVQLERSTVVIATGTTDANGSFAFPGQQPGVYNVRVSAKGYQGVRSDDIFVAPNESRADIQAVLQRSTAGLKTIGMVNASARSALQSTATINEHLDATVLQQQDYVRSGDALATLPFVNGSTSSSLGDDLTLSIRGFDPTETATLLDGHPIGPIGAFGKGYDFQTSPFWGISGMDVTYGSGATGLYGTATIAGAVDFQTVNPTRTAQSLFTQGIGNDGKEMSGLQFTGSIGKLGYAAAYGVEGTDGELSGNITQSGLLTSPSGSCPGGVNSLPSTRAADVSGCTYAVSGDYDLRNAVGKLTYDFSPRTSVALTTYNATDWADSSGNGDTDYNTYPYVLYNATNSLKGNGNQDTQTLPGGGSVTCTGGFVVLNDTSAGYQCMNPAQYATAFSGPFGGGVGRYHDARNQDYHARVKQVVGTTSFVLDGFVDNYGFDNIKGPGSAHHYTDIYRTHGLLASDELASGKHDLTAGIFLEHQQHVGDDIGAGTVNPDLMMSMSNYFLRDAYTPNLKFTTFADLAIQRSQETATTYVNPRLSLVFRPTSEDVIRLTGGRSSSVPDPSLLYGPFSFGAVQSFNPVCNGGLNSIGSGSSPSLKPESATDAEIAYGHRFNAQTVVQADLYDSTEQDPLVSGNFPLSVVPAGQTLSAAQLATYVQKLSQACGPGYTTSNLGVSTMFNAGSAHYKGVDLNLSTQLATNLKLSAEYAIQSASYSGIGNDILATNAALINGAQFAGVPMHRASLGLGYSSPSGFGARIDGYYVGYPNGLNRYAYRFANFNAFRNVGRTLTLNVGVNNLFNSDAQQYGLIGEGPFHAFNPVWAAQQVATGGTVPQNAFDEGSEEYGLPNRQIWITLTRRI